MNLNNEKNKRSVEFNACVRCGMKSLDDPRLAMNDMGEELQMYIDGEYECTTTLKNDDTTPVSRSNQSMVENRNDESIDGIYDKEFPSCYGEVVKINGYPYRDTLNVYDMIPSSLKDTEKRRVYWIIHSYGIDLSKPGSRIILDNDKLQVYVGEYEKPSLVFRVDVNNESVEGNDMTVSDTGTSNKQMENKSNDAELYLKYPSVMNVVKGILNKYNEQMDSKQVRLEPDGNMIHIYVLNEYKSSAMVERVDGTIVATEVNKNNVKPEKTVKEKFTDIMKMVDYICNTKVDPLVDKRVYFTPRYKSIQNHIFEVYLGLQLIGAFKETHPEYHDCVIYEEIDKKSDEYLTAKFGCTKNSPLSMEGKTLHFTHNDADGLGCALVTNFMLKGDLNCKTSFNGIYDIDKKVNETIDAIDAGEIENVKNIIVSDISISDETAERLDECATKYGITLILVDHHKSNKLPEKFNWCYVNESSGKSACVLLKEYLKNRSMQFNHESSLDNVLNKISRYDTWAWKQDPRGDMDEEYYDIMIKLYGINEAFHTIRYNIDRYGYGITATDEKIIAAYQSKRDIDIEKQKKKFVRMKLYEYQVAVMVGDTDYINELCDKVCEDESVDIAVVLFPSSRIISFRSKKTDLNLSRLAKQIFNGGGHPQAAGAKLSTDDAMKLIRMYYKHMEENQSNDKKQVTEHNTTNKHTSNAVANEIASLIIRIMDMIKDESDKSNKPYLIGLECLRNHPIIDSIREYYNTIYKDQKVDEIIKTIVASRLALYVTPDDVNEYIRSKGISKYKSIYDFGYDFLDGFNDEKGEQ